MWRRNAGNVWDTRTAGGKLNTLQKSLHKLPPPPCPNKQQQSAETQHLIRISHKSNFLFLTGVFCLFVCLFVCLCVCVCVGLYLCVCWFWSGRPFLPAARAPAFPAFSYLGGENWRRSKWRPTRRSLSFKWVSCVVASPVRQLTVHGEAEPAMRRRDTASELLFRFLSRIIVTEVDGRPFDR